MRRFFNKSKMPEASAEMAKALGGLLKKGDADKIQCASCHEEGTTKLQRQLVSPVILDEDGSASGEQFFCALTLCSHCGLMNMHRISTFENTIKDIKKEDSDPASSQADGSDLGQSPQEVDDTQQEVGT